MACGCSKNKVAQPVVPQQNVLQNSSNSNNRNNIDFSNHPEFVKAIYKGPEGYTHLIGSPTGIIANFGIRDYGLGKGGSIIYVHKADLEKNSWLYEVIPQVSAIAQVQETNETLLTNEELPKVKKLSKVNR